MDYGKYKYELAQKAKESKKNQVKISVKEIQLKPKIDTNDFKIKLQKSIFNSSAASDFTVLF
jgi:translation initiation factor IF-3